MNMDNTEAVAKLAKVIFQATGGKNMPIAAAQAILAAIQADPLAYVKPKPLEFRVDGNDELIAKTQFGLYEIQDCSEFGFDVSFLPADSDVWEPICNEPTLEAAQAAAETHRNEMLAKEFAQ